MHWGTADHVGWKNQAANDSFMFVVFHISLGILPNIAVQICSSSSRSSDNELAGTLWLAFTSRKPELQAFPRCDYFTRSQGNAGSFIKNLQILQPALLVRHPKPFELSEYKSFIKNWGWTLSLKLRSQIKKSWG